MAGLYIHIPFCKQACHYCNFHFSTTQKNKQQIVSAIASEMNLRKGYLNGESISSIYFGGGTPSILSVDEIKQLLNSVYDNFIVEDNAEITLEANPDDLTIEKINELAQTKINRLSIGIQSFFDDDLIWMNRAHQSKQALDCISNAKKAAFENITIDLIYGMPTLTDEKWIANLEMALSLNIDHISSYALTVENKTALDYLIRQKKTLPVNEEQSARQFEMLISILGKNKFEQYEISNFARNKKYAVHNTSYWKNEIYLGVGPSAHSFNKITRCWNVANNVSYLKAIEQNNPLFETEILTIENRLNEYIMTGLRTIWGCDIQFIESEFGQSYSEKITQEIVKMQSAGLIEIKGDIFTLTPKAKLFADKLASDLFQ